MARCPPLRQLMRSAIPKNDLVEQAHAAAGAGCVPRSRRDSIAWIDFNDRVRAAQVLENRCGLGRASPTAATTAGSARREWSARNASSSGSGSLSTGSFSRLASMRANEPGSRCGVSTSAAPKASGTGRMACSGSRIIGVVSDQQQRLLIDRNLGQRFQQSCAEARVEGRTARSMRASRRSRCSNNRRRRCARSSRSASATSRALRSASAWQIS